MKQFNVPAIPDKSSGEGSRKQERPSSITWHPAFIEALQLELDAYRDSLEFHPEYQLTAEPLRIDCLVIKKAKDIIIKKNIAVIFRETNLVEYKSPDDYVSVADFYKVYGYACLYASLEKVPVTNLTISFVESRNPRELLAHLREIRGYKVEESSPGIYTVEGDILPIQIIDSRYLSADENLWLKDLNNRLGIQEIPWILAEIAKLGKAARTGAYLDAIIRANEENMREVFKMSDTQYTAFEELLEEVGWVAKWEARGRAIGEAEGEERKAIDVAKNLINMGFAPETIVSATKLETEKVKALYQEAGKHYS